MECRGMGAQLLDTRVRNWIIVSKSQTNPCDCNAFMKEGDVFFGLNQLPANSCGIFWIISAGSVCINPTPVWTASHAILNMHTHIVDYQLRVWNIKHHTFSVDNSIASCVIDGESVTLTISELHTKQPFVLVNKVDMHIDMDFLKIKKDRLLGRCLVDGDEQLWKIIRIAKAVSEVARKKFDGCLHFADMIFMLRKCTQGRIILRTDDIEEF